MRALVLLAVCACGDRKPTEPLDVLRDADQAWTYEVVRGPSIEQLAAVPGAPQAVCKVRKSDSSFQLPKSMALSELRCAPAARANVPREVDQILFKQLFLVFDRDGVRELPGPGSPPTDKGFALGFTFPKKLDGATWTYDRGDRVQSRVEVRASTATVLGKSRPVWVATSTYTFDSAEPPKRGTAMFAPGVAPVLLCEVEAELWCLRLVGRPAKKPPRPKLVRKPPSAQERADFVRWLTSIDHEPSLFGPLMGGSLVVRDDLPRVEVESHIAVELDAKEARYRGSAVAPGELLERLTADHAKIRDDIALGKVPRSVDREAMQRQIYLAIAADTPWQRVVEVVDVAASAGFTEPLLLFARTPKTPPPPKHWIDDAVAEESIGGNAAEYLGKLTKEILDGCDDIRAAFATDYTRDKPIVDQIIEQLAAVIPKSDCWYDLPALRAALWNTMGNPHPHAVLPVHIADDAARIELPATTPWREASTHFKPGTPVQLGVRD